ncbi:MAG: glycosyltransferase family 2 protein, partial [Chlamydiia bacterium]|nr:glycosyltransferase family 2 protein [Chlamydiia bacterium]
STDGTKDMIVALAGKYPNIHYAFHTRNRGGGAARNTAVEHSEGNIIFCLDSDDVLGPSMLQRMVDYWLEKQCDGVGVSQSIKFNNQDIANVSYITNFDDVGQRVPFESLLDGKWCSLYSTFLITREAHERCGGYPTEHGFDTQGMAFRFLANGLVAYVCPDTVYYHRVNYHDSYYIREEASGRVNKNWFLIFEEFLYLFNDDVKKQILEHELGLSPDDPNWKPILNIVSKKDNIYVSNYRQLVESGREKAIESLGENKDKFSQYCTGMLFLSNGKYLRALQHYSKALELGFTYPMVHFRIIEISLKLSGNPCSAIKMLDTLKSIGLPLAAKMSGFRKVKRYAARSKLFAPVLPLIKHAHDYARGALREKRCRE